jgi:hypothetical protein
MACRGKLSGGMPQEGGPTCCVCQGGLRDVLDIVLRRKGEVEPHPLRMQEWRIVFNRGPFRRYASSHFHLDRRVPRTPACELCPYDAHELALLKTGKNLMVDESACGDLDQGGEGA